MAQSSSLQHFIDFCREYRSTMSNTFQQFCDNPNKLGQATNTLIQRHKQAIEELAKLLDDYNDLYDEYYKCVEGAGWLETLAKERQATIALLESQQSNRDNEEIKRLEEEVNKLSIYRDQLLEAIDERLNRMLQSNGFNINDKDIYEKLVNNKLVDDNFVQSIDPRIDQVDLKKNKIYNKMLFIHEYVKSKKLALENIANTNSLLYNDIDDINNDESFNELLTNISRKRKRPSQRSGETPFQQGSLRAGLLSQASSSTPFGQSTPSAVASSSDVVDDVVDDDYNNLIKQIKSLWNDVSDDDAQRIGRFVNILRQQRITVQRGTNRNNNKKFYIYLNGNPLLNNVHAIMLGSNNKFYINTNGDGFIYQMSLIGIKGISTDDIKYYIDALYFLSKQ